jgi:hypothetical protein
MRVNDQNVRLARPCCGAVGLACEKYRTLSRCSTGEGAHCNRALYFS